MMSNLTSLIQIAGVLTLTACSTVPSDTKLTHGIHPAHIESAAQSETLRAVNDPVCITFYQNVAEAYAVRQRNKATYSQLASMGTNILGAMSGLGSVGQIATQTATNIALSQYQDIPAQQYDPSKPFDAKVINAATNIGCPVTNKPTL